MTQARGRGRGPTGARPRRRPGGIVQAPLGFRRTRERHPRRDQGEAPGRARRRSTGPERGRNPFSAGAGGGPGGGTVAAGSWSSQDGPRPRPVHRPPAGPGGGPGEQSQRDRRPVTADPRGPVTAGSCSPLGRPRTVLSTAHPRGQETGPREQSSGTGDQSRRTWEMDQPGQDRDGVSRQEPKARAGGRPQAVPGGMAGRRSSRRGQGGGSRRGRRRLPHSGTGGVSGRGPRPGRAGSAREPGGRTQSQRDRDTDEAPEWRETPGGRKAGGEGDKASAGTRAAPWWRAQA